MIISPIVFYIRNALVHRSFIVRMSFDTYLHFLRLFYKPLCFKLIILTNVMHKVVPNQRMMKKYGILFYRRECTKILYIWKNILGGKLLQIFSLTVKVFPCMFCTLVALSYHLFIIVIK